MTMQVRLFSCKKVSDLETKINLWLAKNKSLIVRDIKLFKSIDDQDSYNAMIIFEDSYISDDDA